MTLILLFLACLAFSTNFASARLKFNQTISPSPSSTPNATFSMSPTATLSPIPTSPPLPERLVPMMTLWGGAGNDWFGYTVSLSEKGNVLAVCSPYYDEDGLPSVGLIQVFRNQGTRWEEIFNITGEDKYEYVGYDSLSLSGDGKRMILGSYQAYEYRGYVKVVEIDTGKEVKLVGGKKGDRLGVGSSISGDGTRVVLAARSYINIFDVSEDGNLKQIGHGISTDYWWSTVALSANGDVLGIGEESYNNWKGRVRIFGWEERQWKQIGGDIIGDNNRDYLGGSLDLSADGQRVLIGTYWGDYVKIYNYNGTDWEMKGQKLEGGLDDDDRFGYSVSISKDGNRIVVSSWKFKSERRGRALVYQYHDGSWKQIGDDIVGKKVYDHAGWSVSISGDGNNFAIGFPYADLENKQIVGSVTIYKIV